MKAGKKSGMDLLNGSLTDKILLFALPLAAGSMLQQLFNSVDAAVVGKFAGSDALAAVGANTTVVALLVNILVGLSVGSNAVIAAHIGSGHKERISGAVHTTVLLSILCGLLMMTVGIAEAPLILRLTSVPDNVIDQAVLYLRIYCAGMPFIMLYNFGAAILRSIGDTKRPLYSLIISGAANAGMNVVFVVGFRMGVAGVAWATVLSNLISAVMIVVFLLREKGPIRFIPSKLRIDMRELKQILRIGVPAALQALIFAFSNICVQSAINSFGSEAIAGTSISMTLEYMTVYAINGFNAAAVTFTSQNYGAGKADRCRRSWRTIMICTVITCLIMDWGFFLTRGILINLFTDSAEAAGFTVLRMKYVMLWQCLACSYEISGSALRGLGRSMTPTALMVFGTCITRILWVNTVMVKVHQYVVLCAVYPATWIFTGIMVMTAWFVVSGRLFRAMERNRADMRPAE